MVSKILLSVIVAIAVGIGVYLIGVLLTSVSPLGWLVAFGGALQSFAWLIGLLSGLWYFLTNRNPVR